MNSQINQRIVKRQASGIVEWSQTLHEKKNKTKKSAFQWMQSSQGVD